jgi:hypothetical protein
LEEIKGNTGVKEDLRKNKAKLKLLYERKKAKDEYSIT